MGLIEVGLGTTKQVGREDLGSSPNRCRVKDNVSQDRMEPFV